MSSAVVLISIVILASSAVAIALILGRAKAPSRSSDVSLFDPEQLLSPIREQIGVIVKRLDETSTTLTETRISIFQELGNVLTVSKEVRGGNQDLNLKTEQISTALQGTGVRGDWGQISLRRVVEMAGLTKHVTFNEQVTGKDDEGKFTPDMVVKLPGGRSVVVDAKAPEIDLKGEKEIPTAKLLKKHINDLAERDYGARVPNAIDFTVLFVPSEGVMATALTEDQALSELAFGKKILLATPMTLLALLKAIEFGWKQSEQMENVDLILKEAKELCERFGILGEHFQSVGTSLNTAVDFYNQAVASLNGRLKPQILKIGGMGVDVKRSQSNFSEVDLHPKNMETD